MSSRPHKVLTLSILRLLFLFRCLSNGGIHGWRVKKVRRLSYNDLEFKSRRTIDGDFTALVDRHCWALGGQECVHDRGVKLHRHAEMLA